MNITLLARSLFAIALIGVTVLAVVPQESVIVTSGWDKANHLIAFFVLLALLDTAYPALYFLRQKILILIGYGILLELLQGMIADRDASLLDVLADCAGLAVYAIIRPALLPLLYRLRLRNRV
ncbi:MAG: VanZ family protein [Oceanicoccus sp.]